MTWLEDSEWEAAWWGNCVNTLREELLQIEYAKRMGLVFTPTDRSPYVIDMGGKVVVDIGGGPCSLLLKCVNVKGIVVDPCRYPHWTVMRYLAAGIEKVLAKAEHVGAVWFIRPIDEVWIYNVLQHVENPQKIIANARAIAPTIRIFEWIDTAVSPGHPHSLSRNDLTDWLDGSGTAELFTLHGACGWCYYGTFGRDVVK